MIGIARARAQQRGLEQLPPGTGHLCECVNTVDGRMCRNWAKYKTSGGKYVCSLHTKNCVSKYAWNEEPSEDDFEEQPKKSSRHS